MRGLAQGVVSAINLMEFDSGMEQAKSAHLQCIVEMTAFLNSILASRKKPKKIDQACNVEALSSSVRHLRKYGLLIAKAKQVCALDLREHAPCSVLVCRLAQRQ
jgi:hypothetical protein